MLESFSIADRRAAATLASPRARKILLSLIQKEQSLSQLAGLTETPLNLLHHHIRKLLRLGLVRIARKEPRAGAPIKYYRAVARQFFVPAELMETDPGAALASRLRELLALGLARTLRGVLYFHDGNGPRMRQVREPEPGRTATELWLELHLSAGDAAQLADELRALLHRFQGHSPKGRRRYLVHAALAPVERPRGGL